MDDVLEAFEFRGMMVLLAVDSARALRFGGILGVGGEKCYRRMQSGQLKRKEQDTTLRRLKREVVGRLFTTTSFIYAQKSRLGVAR
jgi:hypothetical protein